MEFLKRLEEARTHPNCRFVLSASEAVAILDAFFPPAPSPSDQETAREIVMPWDVDNSDHDCNRPHCDDCVRKAFAAALSGAAARMQERCARAVPSNWVDSLLTGDKAIPIRTDGLKKGEAFYRTADVERLLLAVAARIRALPPEEK